MKNKVSILTPCYNSQDYIGRYIEKMLNQTYDNVELVFINDGSTDGTEEVIFSYLKKIKQRGYEIVYLKKENGGLGSAINVGIKHMTGDFFAWCDSDNFYDDYYIEENMEIFENNSCCNSVRCDGYFVYEGNLDKPYRKFSDGNFDIYQPDLFLNSILEFNFHFGCIMFRTKAFDTVNPNREIYESREGQNWQLILPMFYKYKSFYINKPLFYFVNRKGSITNQTITGDLQTKLAQQNEHEKILITTIKGMKIKNEKYYLDLIKRKYIIRRIELATIYCNYEILKEQQRELKKADNFIRRAKINLIKLFIKRNIL